MSDYETLKVPEIKYNTSAGHYPFGFIKCPNNCGGAIMSTNDGNRTQTCLGCNTKLMVDGKLMVKNNKPLIYNTQNNDC